MIDAEFKIGVSAHGLLHIVLIDWNCDKDHPPQEWAINQIAKAFVDTKRKASKRAKPAQKEK